MYHNLAANVLIYASLYFQTCSILAILTSESTRVSDFSPHAFLQVVDIVCDIIRAMIDKTSIAFNLCYHKNSLQSVVISVETY